jgi:hypothetical protein
MVGGNSGDGVGGSISSGRGIVGRVVVAGVRVDTEGQFGDDTSVCVCDAGVVRFTAGGD